MDGDPATTDPATTDPATTERDRPYHHGDLPGAVMREVLAVVTERGAAAVSLRDIARRAGVAHTSVAHHFGDKAGLFTAVAIDGYRLLADELSGVVERDEGFLELGVAYVRFAVKHPGHFEVMFRPDLYRADHPDLRAARSHTSTMLYGTAAQMPPHGTSSNATPDSTTPDQTMMAGVAGWAMVHGVASLWLSGSLPAQLGDDPEAITRAVARRFGPRRT